MYSNTPFLLDLGFVRVRVCADTRRISPYSGYNVRGSLPAEYFAFWSSHRHGPIENFPIRRLFAINDVRDVYYAATLIHISISVNSLNSSPKRNPANTALVASVRLCLCRSKINTMIPDNRRSVCKQARIRMPRNKLIRLRAVYLFSPYFFENTAARTRNILHIFEFRTSLHLHLFFA